MARKKNVISKSSGCYKVVRKNTSRHVRKAHFNLRVYLGTTGKNHRIIHIT